MIQQRIRYALPHLVMLGVSLALYAAAQQIDTAGAQGGRIGPDFWPKLIVAMMGLLCFYEALRRLLLGRGSSEELPPGKKAGDGPAEEPPEAGVEQPLHWGMLAGGTALIVGYVPGVALLGFFVTTALFLAGFAWIGGFRRPLLNLAIGLAGSLVLVVIFMRIAYISLPLGAGPFHTLSVGLLGLIGVK